jgi:hypothetical protein
VVLKINILPFSSYWVNSASKYLADSKPGRRAWLALLILEKNKNLRVYFIGLNWYWDIFRKSQEVSAFNF